MKVAVLGSGAGGLAVAADMSRHGRHTVMADFADFGANLEPVAESGGVTVSSDWHGAPVEPGTGAPVEPVVGAAGLSAAGEPVVVEPVGVAAGIPEALDGAELAVVVAPCSAHERWVRAIAPHVTADQTVLFVGGGGGAIVARRAIEPPTTVAEVNTLPYLVRPSGPGAVTAFRKLGGVLIAALPSTPNETARVMGLIDDVWPCATATDTVWSTVLASYDAIDRVATAAAIAGTLENCTGAMPLGGEDATPAVLNVIEAVDAELLALRRALNSKEPRGYRDFLVAQGLAPDLGGSGATLFHTVRASEPVPGRAPTAAAGGLDTGYITDDVPCALVLASSLGEAAGVPTPVIDGLVAAASAMLGPDFRAEGPTLATLGLGGLDVTGLVGFARTGMFP